MLCLSVEGKDTQVVYAILYDMVDLKIGSTQVYL
jgi:hypothetical protein